MEMEPLQGQPWEQEAGSTEDVLQLPVKEDGEGALAEQIGEPVTKQGEQQQADDVPDFGGMGASEELDLETAHEKFQARVKAAVSRDIKKLLLSSKAYVKHYSSPPSISAAQLKSLSQPKPSLMHPETELARSLGDPVEYARRKAEQLRVAREQSQRVAQAQAAQAAETQRRLLSYQDSKYRQEEMKAVMKQQEEQEQQRYAAQVSRYVTDRAKAELQLYKERQQAAKARADKLHAKILRSQFAV